MKKIAIIIWLVLLMQAVVFAQNKNQPLYMVKRFPSEATLDPIQEMALKLSNIRSAEVDSIYRQSARISNRARRRIRRAGESVCQDYV
jgi:hypothetical protein